MNESAIRSLSLLVLFVSGCGSDPAGPGADAAVDGGSDSGSVGDTAVPEDSATADSSPAVDSGGGDARTDSASSDSGAMDTGGADTTVACVPETMTAFCARLSAECGSISGTDNCGSPRTESCGACTGPTSCGGGSAAANRCGCATPPDVTDLRVNCASGSARVTFTGTTTIYHYGFTLSSLGTPPPCSPSSSAFVGTAGSNTTTLPGGPPLGQCGAYRICAYEMACDTDDSPGRLVTMCVDSVGVATCSVI